MGVAYGITPQWIDANPDKWYKAVSGVVTDGLVLALDAGISRSYPGSGTTWTDLSGNGRNATLYNMDGANFDSADGGTLTFDGVNEYSEITGASDLGGFTGDFSIEFWFKGGNQGGFAVFLEHYGPSTQLWAIQAESNGTTNMIWVRNGSILLTTSGIDALDDAWHQHVVSRVGSTITYYIDTVSRGSETYSGTLSSGTTLGIGKYSPGSYHINGNLSNVRIYSGKGLTADEVSQNFNALRSRFGI